ncbi:T9SS type A sorting domain-containing protein [Croceimicrobium sp.]|uniref:T9SS type A sorting domain-containing protein n=1 Tax=Croceimicrobium sp. TaxID=2828340 RepID=UPI003BA924BC
MVRIRGSLQLYSADHWGDKGIIATGTYFDRYLNPSPYNVYVWLLSLDDSGCLGAGDCGSDISFVEWVLPEQGLSVYPNPAHDYLNLEMGLPECQNMQGTAHIFSLDGELVLEEKVQFFQGELRLDVSKLNQGQYVLELKTNRSLFLVRVLIH